MIDIFDLNDFQLTPKDRCRITIYIENYNVLDIFYKKMFLLEETRNNIDKIKIFLEIVEASKSKFENRD